MSKPLYHFIITLSIIGFLILPGFSFAQVENKYPEAPETFEEAEDFLFEIIKPLPDAVKGAWQEALAIWQKMAGFFGDIWDIKVKPWLESIWREILSFFGKELEKKELMIEKEIEKEKEEIKKEIPKIGQSIWERLKGLIR